MNFDQVVASEAKNFPPFIHLIHHDIRNDIPENRRAIQYSAFYSWLGIQFCLLYNLAAAIVSWALGTFSFTDGIGNFFLALIYLVLAVPLSYFLWYKPLYNGMRKDGFVRFTMFFIVYAFHILFCLFATVAPPFLWHGYSFTGFMSATNLLINSWIIVSVVYYVGAGFFCLESMLSIYVIGRVYAYVRGRA